MLATLVILMVFVMVLFPVVRVSFGGSDSGVAASTIQREALPAGAVNETDYYTDECGWISNTSQLTDGMKTFYRLTGVQPYLYIANEVDGSNRPSPDAIVLSYIKNPIVNAGKNVTILFFSKLSYKYETTSLYSFSMTPFPLSI